MSDDTGELLLSRARSGMTPGAREKARMRARLLAAVGAAGTVGSAGAAAAASGWSKLAVSLAGLSLVGLAAVGIGMSAGSPTAPSEAGHAGRPSISTAPARPPEAAPDVEPWVEPDVAVGRGTSVPDAIAPARTPEVVAARAPRTRTRTLEVSPDLAPTPPMVSTSHLAEETALIARARGALRASDAGASLAALEEHARRFPDGMLAEERDILRIRSLCSLGERSRAEAEVASFQRLHPRSVHTVVGCEGP